MIAAHADQALRMRPNPSDDERDILSCFPYQGNEAILHHDERFLPKRKKAWAAWNYHRPNTSSDDGEAQRVTLTYNLNILQGHASKTQFLVSLNPHKQIDPAKIVQRIPYAHPSSVPRHPRPSVATAKSAAKKAFTIAAPTGVMVFTKTACKAACAWAGPLGLRN